MSLSDIAIGAIIGAVGTALFTTQTGRAIKGASSSAIQLGARSAQRRIEHHRSKSSKSSRKNLQLSR